MRGLTLLITNGWWSENNPPFVYFLGLASFFSLGCLAGAACFVSFSVFTSLTTGSVSSFTGLTGFVSFATGASFFSLAGFLSLISFSAGRLALLPLSAFFLGRLTPKVPSIILPLLDFLSLFPIIIYFQKLS